MTKSCGSTDRFSVSQLLTHSVHEPLDKNRCWLGVALWEGVPTVHDIKLRFSFATYDCPEVEWYGGALCIPDWSNQRFWYPVYHQRVRKLIMWELQSLLEVGE